MSITLRSIVNDTVAIAYDSGVEFVSDYITSEVFSTKGMRGKKVLVQPTVLTQLTLEGTSALLGVTIQYSMDGVNFVNSPAATITPTIATAGTSLAVGVKTPYVVDMTDLMMPYVRAIWTAYQSDGTTQRDIDAGIIKTTFCAGND